MKETITTEVNIIDGDESQLSFTYNEDIITLKLDGKEICKMEYNYNLVPMIKRMIKMWGEPEE